MARPAIELGLTHDALGFTERIERPRHGMVSRIPGTNRFAASYQVGNVLHFDDGAEIDTTIIPTGAAPNSAGFWYEMLTAEYQAMIGRDSAATFDAAQVIRFLRGSEYIDLDVEALQWTNDNSQISPIAIPQGVPGVVGEDKVSWTAAYGTGFDYEVDLQTVRLQKRLTIQSALTAPPQFIIDGGNAVFEMRYILARSGGLEIWTDGTLWNEGNNTERLTSSAVEFRSVATGEVAFTVPVPWATDNSLTNEGEIRGSLYLRKRPGEIQVGVRIPWAWLETAVYPLVIDPTVDYQIDASGGDGFESNGLCKTDYVSSISDAQTEIFGLRWTGVTIPDGATIDVATLDCYISHAALDEPNHTVDFDDSLNPAALAHDVSTASYDYSGRTGTTATATAGDGTNQGGPGWFSALSMGAVDIEPIISELVASYDYSSGSAMMCRIAGSANPAEDLQLYFYDQSSTYGAKLHIEYTESGGGSIPASATDGLSLGESSARIKTMPVGVVDGLTLGGSPIRQAVFASGSIDGLVFGETALVTLYFSGVAIDGLTLGETAVATAILAALASDGLLWSEEALGSIAGGIVEIPASATDGLVMGETAVATAQLVAIIADGLQLSESVVRVAQRLASAVDGVVIGESSGRTAVFTVNPSDGVTFAESLTAIMQFMMVIGDVLQLGDVAVHTQARGEVTITFSLKKAAIAFSIKQPGVGFSMKQPGITFVRGDET